MRWTCTGQEKALKELEKKMDKNSAVLDWWSKTSYEIAVLDKDEKLLFDEAERLKINVTSAP